jgi:hypothetical protein
MSRYINRVAAMAAVCLLVACATKAPAVGGAVAVDESHGAVFGRMRVIKDGEAYGSDSPRAHMTFQFHPFEGPHKLRDPYYQSAKWAIKVELGDDGYFSTVLPAGKYYAVNFALVGFAESYGWLCTYNSSSRAKMREPSLLLFEVEPGKATYIGDFVHTLRGNTWSLDIRDNDPGLRKWLRGAHPEHSEYVTQLARIGPLQY